MFVQVHERDKDTDFCLLLVMRLLRTNSRNVKVEQYMSQLHVASPSLPPLSPPLSSSLLLLLSPSLQVILMSATLESSKFAKYFEVRGGGGTVITPPILNIEGQVFPVYEFFLDSLKNFGTVSWWVWLLL